MGKKARKREERQVQELKAVHPLTGRKRRTTHHLAWSLEYTQAESEKSWGKCESPLFVCGAQPSQRSPAQGLNTCRSTWLFWSNIAFHIKIPGAD